jgi:5'-deoxynucleotidase YfbR-like HD superfamily hydrolase
LIHIDLVVNFEEKLLGDWSFMENIQQLLNIWKYSSMLKNLPRGGWLMQGVKIPESLGDHSYNVSFIAMTLVNQLKLEKIGNPNMEKVLKTALIHDLPESIITDIPAPMIKYFGKEAKHLAEEKAFNTIFDNYNMKNQLLELWKEFENLSTIEGRLVRVSDKIDMMLQVLHYESIGHRNLNEFWSDGDKIFENITGDKKEMDFYKNIYKAIKKLRLN